MIAIKNERGPKNKNLLNGNASVLMFVLLNSNVVRFD